MSAITHETLRGLAEEYGSAVCARQALVAATRTRLAEVAREMAPALREALGAERALREALVDAVGAVPELFDKPRTRTAGVVRYGWQTGKPSIDIPDPQATIRKIELLPHGQAELLLRRTVAVHKPGLLDLTVADLRRLGVRQIPGADSVVVKAIKDDTDRLVDALLADTEEAAA